MSDPAKYRTPAELEEHKSRDPLHRARTALLEQGLGEAKLDVIDKSIEAEIAEALKFAETSGEPGVDVLEETTYSGPFAY
jgi:pyruvate dehydrogenase E1 component alpha subunit